MRLHTLFTILACSLFSNIAQAQPTPGCINGRLTDPQAYVEAVVGMRVGDPQIGWEAKLAASGIPDGYGPGVRPNYQVHHGITQQIGVGGPRGVIYLPTADPDDLGYYTTQILVVDGLNDTWQFLERFPLGPDYAPGRCDQFDPPPNSDLDAVLELIGEEFASLRAQIATLATKEQITEFRAWAEDEISEVRAEHRAAETQIDGQLPALNGSKWNTVLQVLGIVAGILGIGATTGVVP